MGEDFSLCEGPMDPRTDVVLKTQEGVGWPSKPDVAALLPYLVDELVDHRFGFGSAHALPVSGFLAREPADDNEAYTLTSLLSIRTATRTS